MSKQTLRDNRSNVIGYIETESNGKQTIMSPTGKQLGFYYPERNKTTDARGGEVGTGNLLTSLLGR